MDPFEKRQRIRDARHRLIAQRRRAGLLRSRVIALSLVVFAMLWAVVFVQMATGDDPVLGGRQATSASAAPSERRTDSREVGRAGAGAAEAIETTSPEESEPESVETLPIESEPIELEPEPAPVETAQS